LNGRKSLMLNGVLNGELATLATSRVVDICPSISQLSYRSVWIRVVNRTEVCQV